MEEEEDDDDEKDADERRREKKDERSFAQRARCVESVKTAFYK